MKKTDSVKNPFPYSDTNRRFHTFDYYMRGKFGHKCAKVPIDAGFTCPNIDGTVSFGGCSYCALAVSGCERDTRPFAVQYEEKLSMLRRKWKDCIGIPYLQDYTNTYAPLQRLESTYREILSIPGTEGMHIATRADCLPEPTLDLLENIAREKFLVVELGLQTAFDSTAEKINRGHSYDEFLRSYEKLSKRGINVCVHIINGLPGESPEMMCITAEKLAKLRPHSLKIHLLHIMDGTRMAEQYMRGEFDVMTLEDYVSVVVSQLELMPAETVIGRVTGDGTADRLIAPEWSKKKFVVMNEIDKEFVRRCSMQGSRYCG